MSLGAFLSTLSSECQPCAAAVAMSCSTSNGGEDCGDCAVQFERNLGCPVLRSGQDLAPYFPSGCLSCVLEIGMRCAPPASEDEAQIEIPAGADCRQCVTDFGADACDRLLADVDAGAMASFVDSSCLSCSTAILESCAVAEERELEDFDCDHLDPGHGEYQDCTRAFESHGGCDHMLSGANPMHWLDHACRGCVAEAGMYCVLRRPEPQPMRSLPSILLDRGITKIYVVGLVYDFCVAETAIFGMEGLSLWTNFEQTESGITPEVIREQGYYGVTVLTDLTRPSFDGKPGAPYTQGMCDGSEDPANPAFCTEGAGTTQAHVNWKTDMEAAGVNVSRRADVDCMRVRPTLLI